MAITKVLKNKIIAVVDDDKMLAETTAWDVIEAGYEPFLLFDGNFTDVNAMVSFILSNNAVGAVCDHRLSNSGLANFDGAKLVAALYDIKFPSLLVTQFTEMDTSFSIRKCRNKIPVLLSREETNASSIAKGIEICTSELCGKIPSTRKTRRTIVSITNIAQESGETVVDAFVPSWNPHKAVRFPAILVPEHLRDSLKPNVCLFAHVNTGAEKSDDLYFEKFELAPEPDEDDELA